MHDVFRFDQPIYDHEFIYPGILFRSLNTARELLIAWTDDRQIELDLTIYAGLSNELADFGLIRYTSVFYCREQASSIIDPLAVTGFKRRRSLMNLSNGDSLPIILYQVQKTVAAHTVDWDDLVIKTRPSSSITELSQCRLPNLDVWNGAQGALGVYFRSRIVNALEASELRIAGRFTPIKVVE